MKRVLLLVVLIMGLSTVQAQIDGGTMLAGGSATFNHYSNKDLNVKSTYLSIQPQFGLAFPALPMFLLGLSHHSYAII